MAIDKNVVDAWGIPALHIQAMYSDNEFKMAKHAMNTFDELCRAAGFEVLLPSTTKCSLPDTASMSWRPAAWATIRRPAS